MDGEPSIQVWKHPEMDILRVQLDGDEIREVNFARFEYGDPVNDVPDDWMLLAPVATSRENTENENGDEPQHGARAACRVCDLDIEFGYGEWIDRGGNKRCATGGGAKYDVDGNPIPLPDTPHVPLKD